MPLHGPFVLTEKLQQLAASIRLHIQHQNQSVGDCKMKPGVSIALIVCGTLLLLCPYADSITRTTVVGRVLESRKELTSVSLSEVDKPIEAVYGFTGITMIAIGVWRSFSRHAN